MLLVVASVLLGVGLFAPCMTLQPSFGNLTWLARLIDPGLVAPTTYSLLEGIRSLLPEAINWPQMEHWWGFRPCTPDLKPIIGKSKIENLFIATGHYRNGVLFSAITSDLLLKIVQNKNLNEIEKSFLEKFSLDRFAI